MAGFVSGGVRATCSKLAAFTTRTSIQQNKRLISSDLRPLAATASARSRRQATGWIPDSSKQWTAVSNIRCMSSSKTCAETAQTLCWSCKSDLKHNDDFVVCKKCNSLRLVPEKLNYFDLFGCSEHSFKVDLKALKQKHKKLQMVLHPDRFTLSSDEEKALSDIWSPIVNEAYYILKKPVRRANYLLYLRGRPLHEGEEVGLDANFLAEIVELNEEIVEAEIESDVSGLMLHVREVLQSLFDKAEVAFDVENDLDRARLVTAQIRYYENLKKKLVERELEFGLNQ